MVMKMLNLSLQSKVLDGCTRGCRHWGHVSDSLRHFFAHFKQTSALQHLGLVFQGLRISLCSKQMQHVALTISLFFLETRDNILNKTKGFFLL